MSYSYRNPWHQPGAPEYGPAVYVRDCPPPEEYRGFLIYEVTGEHGVQWDVVQDGVCRSQRAGPNGARQWVDEELEGDHDWDGT